MNMSKRELRKMGYTQSWYRKLMFKWFGETNIFGWLMLLNAILAISGIALVICAIIAGIHFVYKYW